MEPIALLAFLGLIGGAIWIATRPPPALPPAGGYALQLRPLPIPGPGVPAITRTSIISTSQMQLAALGYPVSRTDGVMDSATTIASQQFQAANAQAILAMKQALGRTDDGVELSVLDNLYRQKFGLPTIPS